MNRIWTILFGLLAFSANAQDTNYPNKPIRLIVGYAPGGATDIVARSIAIKLQETLGRGTAIERRIMKWLSGTLNRGRFNARISPVGMPSAALDLRTQAYSNPSLRPSRAATSTMVCPLSITCLTASALNSAVYLVLSMSSSPFQFHLLDIY